MTFPEFPISSMHIAYVSLWRQAGWNRKAT
jgi:hypothetical protein